MKKSIKLQVLEQIAETKREVKASELKKFIWNAQRVNGSQTSFAKNEFKNISSYYADAIAEWIKDKLLERTRRGFYNITPKGKKYVKNPKKVQSQITESKRKLRDKFDRIEIQSAIDNINDANEYFYHCFGNRSGDTAYYLRMLQMGANTLKDKVQ